MQSKSSTISLEASPYVGLVLIGWRDVEDLAVEPLHTFQIFYVKYRVVRAHIGR